MFTFKLTTMEIYLYYCLATDGEHIALHAHPNVTDDFKNTQV